MKVLITGATGLVGNAITKALHKQNVPVHYLTTRSEKITTSDNYKGFLWNPEKGEIDLACFEGVTAIINLAGASIAKKWTDLYKEKVLSSRLDSLTTLQNGLSQVDVSGITNFLSASAIGIYPSSQIDLCDEADSSVDKSFLGHVVEKWEEKINTFEKFPFNVATVRIGIVLSTEGGALPQMAKPVRNFMGAALGSGEQWQSWIHIDDLARLFLYILEKDLSGTYNAVAPNPVTNAKMTKVMAKALKRPILLPNVPKFMLKLILGEMSYLLLASHRVCSKRIEKKGFSFQFSNIDPALDNLLGKANVTRDETSMSLDEKYI